mmetsp:Transcript_24323/g.39125  ORF Transcript_24323/g.39125 Transcript_24323/m.39125 type:complete len:240 (-) Transcript_24323:884-1603(-)
MKRADCDAPAGRLLPHCARLVQKVTLQHRAVRAEVLEGKAGLEQLDKVKTSEVIRVHRYQPPLVSIDEVGRGPVVQHCPGPDGVGHPLRREHVHELAARRSKSIQHVGPRVRVEVGVRQHRVGHPLVVEVSHPLQASRVKRRKKLLARFVLEHAKRPDEVAQHVRRGVIVGLAQVGHTRCFQALHRRARWQVLELRQRVRHVGDSLHVQVLLGEVRHAVAHHAQTLHSWVFFEGLEGPQ